MARPVRNTLSHRGLLLPTILVLIFASATHVCGQADPESRSWNQPIKPYRIIGNLYYVGATEVSSYLIVTPKGHILLDSGFEETVPQIERNIAELGFRVADVKILINSHAHYDHAGGLAALKKLTGAKLMATEADARLLARGGKDDPNFGDRFLFPPVTVDTLLRNGDKVELGGITMISHLTPGHTPGCTTWTMKVTEGSRQYDVVFIGSVTAPGYKLVENAAYPTIVQDYEHTFRVLKALPCDVFLAAHPSAYSMLQKLKISANNGRNRFIDPNGYRSYVAESERKFREQLQQQRTSLKPK
jgi:metallo-beta-lactamase class B